MFVVTKRFGRAESRLSDFTKEKDAIDFIFAQLADDKRMVITATYGLYEGADLLREYSQENLPTTASEADAADATSADKSSGKRFAPTPFSTTPRLGPQTWVKDDGKNDEDDKK